MDETIYKIYLLALIHNVKIKYYAEPHQYGIVFKNMSLSANELYTFFNANNIRCIDE